MTIRKDILDLIDANPGVDIQKILRILEKSQAHGHRRKGYSLASPLNIHRYKMRIAKPDNAIRLHTRHR